MSTKTPSSLALIRGHLFVPGDKFPPKHKTLSLMRIRARIYCADLRQYRAKSPYLSKKYLERKLFKRPEKQESLNLKVITKIKLKRDHRHQQNLVPKWPCSNDKRLARKSSTRMSPWRMARSPCCGRKLLLARRNARKFQLRLRKPKEMPGTKNIIRNLISSTGALPLERWRSTTKAYFALTWIDGESRRKSKAWLLLRTLQAPTQSKNLGNQRHQTAKFH